MNLTTEFMNKGLISCDQRINKMEKDKEKVVCAEMISSFSKIMIERLNDTKEDIKLENKYEGRVKYYENCIKLVQVEKLIYNALLKDNNNTIFPRLLNKYDELLGLSYDMSGNMVLLGIYKEGDYLEYCKRSLEQREYINSICVYGERR
jgi:hypothetical protein